MLQFSASVAAEIAAGTARGFICVLIKDASDTVLLASTSHFADVTLGDTITYVSDDNIITVEPPQFNTTVDREEYRITIVGEGLDADADLVGCKMEVRLCFQNSSTGLPYTDLSDTVLFYKGRVSGKAGEFDTEDLGSLQYSIKGASPMMALEMTGGIYLSRDFIRSISPLDSCCDEIYQGSAALVLKWGRL